MDYTGHIYFKYTVLRRDESRIKDLGRTYWFCKCECGNEKSVEIHMLRRGQVRSCGCLKRKTDAEYLVNKIIEFEKKIEKTPYCWIWKGRTHRQGYGYTSIRSRQVLAHRLSWELYKGKIPEGMKVCHKCDNVLCVNPDHLFIGTQLENVKDMWSKGRGPNNKLENHPGFKMTPEKIRKVREKLSMGISQDKIAKELGISQTTVGKIRLGKRWSHII